MKVNIFHKDKLKWSTYINPKECNQIFLTVGKEDIVIQIMNDKKG